MPQKASTVLVVDDDPSLREALQDLLESVGYRARTFASVAEFLAAEPAPDGPACLVLDVRLPGQSGLDLQAALARSDNQPPIVFITGHGDIPMSVRAMKAGAVEFLPKPFREQDLLDAIGVALERDRRRRAEQRVQQDLRRRLETLTAREREILSLVAAGLMNKQIAGHLDVSEITVKVHRGQVMRKMRARSLAELVLMADRLGLAPRPANGDHTKV
ncbi:MAG TPA: response regulator transcription factor [Caulobacteraceae bacterium]|nr:response regulator transcription factor [Caulobacteraceae bacterium]